jgi:hypothetical protein
MPETEGPEAAGAIAKEFNEFRGPRYLNAICAFERGVLILSCDNDGWDANGLNLMDEFSDCLAAYIATPFDGELRFVSSTKLADQ